MSSPPALDCLCVACEQEHRQTAQRPPAGLVPAPRPHHPGVLRQRRGERLTVPCDCLRCEAVPCTCRLCTTNRAAAAAAVQRRAEAGAL